jgi:anti-sigma factor RsiW
MKHDDHLAEISAYIDGELMPEEIVAMREHLASCGECAAEYETLLGVSKRVKEAYERPRVPEALRARIHDALQAAENEVIPVRRARLPWTQLIAAGLVVAVLSGGASYAVARRGEPAASMAGEVLASHIRSLMPGHLTDVTSNDTHNVKPWFNGRLDLSPNVPRLDSLGFPLAGGRLDYAGGRPVAAVVYMRRQHVINVFSWPTAERRDTPRTLTSENGYHLVHWRRDGAEYWVASDVNVADLDQFVDLFTRNEGAAKEH